MTALHGIVKELMESDLVLRIGVGLLHSLWQSALIAMMLWVVLFALRERTARARYAAGCGAMLLMLLAPAVSAWLWFGGGGSATRSVVPPNSLVDTTRAGGGDTNAVAATSYGDLVGAVSIPGPPQPAPAAVAGVDHGSGHVTAASDGHWLPWLVILWLAGVLGLSAWHAAGLLAVRRLKRSGLPPTDAMAERVARMARRVGVRRSVRIFQCPRVDVPAVAGFFRPVLMLPVSLASGLPPAQLDAILAHELAHVRRHDCVVNLLQTAMEILLFYHPAVWWASRRVRLERELCCDDVALAACGGGRVAYAEALASIERARAVPARAALAVSGSGRGASGYLLGRVRRVLGAGPDDLARPRAAAGFGLLALTVAFALLCVTVGSMPPATSSVAEAFAPVATQEGEPLREPAVTGRVVSQEGKAISDARITLLVPSGMDREFTTVASARSGPDGSFRARLPKPGGAEPASYQLLVEAEGFGINAAHVGTPEDQPLRADVELRPIRMKPEAPLTMTFVGPDGKPVPDLRVVPRTIAERGIPAFATAASVVLVGGEARERLTARTDADGTCTLHGLPQQSVVQLEIDDDRFARLTWADRALTGTGATRAERAVRLTAAASVVGHVRYGGTGKPAAGIRVTAQSLNPGHGWGEAVTNDRGEYAVKQLPRGSYNVCLKLGPDTEKDWTASAVEVTVAEGERREHQDLTLIKGGVIDGKVVLKDSGAGAPDIYVGLHGPSRPRSSAMIQGTKTGPDGRFSFRVPPGENDVYVSGPAPEGYLRPEVGSPRRVLEVGVADGQTVPVTLELPRDPSPTVSGHVVDGAGNPVAWAFVSAEDPRDDLDQRFTRTDATGQFRLAAPRGSKLRAGKGTLRTAEAHVTRGAEEDLVLRVQAVADASALVRVTAGGKPIEGARIKMTVWHGGSGSGSSNPATTDAQGRLLFQGLSADVHYTLQVEAEGFGKLYPELKLTPGRQTEVDVTFDGPGRGE